MRSPSGPSGYNAAASAKSAHCWNEVSELKKSFWGAVPTYLGRDVACRDDK
jgi:hypothetical protein